MAREVNTKRWFFFIQSLQFTGKGISSEYGYAADFKGVFTQRHVPRSSAGAAVYNTIINVQIKKPFNSHELHHGAVMKEKHARLLWEQDFKMVHLSS